MELSLRTFSFTFVVLTQNLDAALMFDAKMLRNRAAFRLMFWQPTSDCSNFCRLWTPLKSGHKKKNRFDFLQRVDLLLTRSLFRRAFLHTTFEICGISTPLLHVRLQKVSLQTILT